MYQNSNAGNNGLVAGPAHQQANINYNGMQQQQNQTQQQQQQQQQLQPQQQLQQLQQQAHPQQPTRSARRKPYVRITEQPAPKALRFRYECEGRSAGSIPGVNSTAENKTYPTIEIVGYNGRAVVVVSCVTKDAPHRPHPHNIVGKEGCKKGVCTLEINCETMNAVFSNLGIQCVKRKDIEAALKAREEIRVDPFKTGFSHRYQPASIDLNSVRLCFQVFLESEQKGRFTQPIAPVVSEPIYDKKAMSDLVICRLCSCSASVLGNTQIILLCEKVAKEDISVRFYEEKNGQVLWEAFGDFQNTDVHKQTAIAFRTPRYHTIDITEPAKVFIQLRRPSDGVTSEALPFEFVPLDSGRPKYWNLRRNLKRKPDDQDIFQQILSVDTGGGGGVVDNACNGDGLDSIAAVKTATADVIDLDTATIEQTDFGKAVAKNNNNETANTAPAEAMEVVLESNANTETVEAAQRRNEHEIDTIIDEKVRELEQQQQQQLQLEQQKSLDIESGSTTATNTTVISPSEVSQLSANDKICEWMKSSEFAQMASPVIDEAQTTSKLNANFNPQTSILDEDKTLCELLEQVAELDEIYTDHVLRRQTYQNTLLNEVAAADAANSTATVDDARGRAKTLAMEDSFDDAATYTSLQIAYKHPIEMSLDEHMPPTPPASKLSTEDLQQRYDPVSVAPIGRRTVSSTSLPQSGIQTLQYPPVRPTVTPARSSPRMQLGATAAEEEKRPPLPPKRLRKQDSNAENRSIEANTVAENSNSNSGDKKLGTAAQQQTPIYIMRTPDSSPPTKRLPATPTQTTTVQTKQKKPGFFSKLFSRRKSKSDLAKARSEMQLSNTQNLSRNSSVANFSYNENSRNSMRSVKSLQPLGHNAVSSGSNARVPPRKPMGTGKPVTRSVSSVSGKRPAHLNADVIHIPLKGGSTTSLPQQEAYSNASTITLSRHRLDERTTSALQLADIPLCEGNMELVAIADRQSLRNLCAGEFNVQLDPEVDLTEAEHYALYTSVPPKATASEFDDTSCYYAQVDAGEILTPDEIAKRIAIANAAQQ